MGALFMPCPGILVQGILHACMLFASNGQLWQRTPEQAAHILQGTAMMRLTGTWRWRTWG